jgi:hypothetical protein
MKLFPHLFLAAFLACSSDSKTTTPADTSSPPAAAGTGQPCTQEVSLVCPDGQIDSCEKAPRLSAGAMAVSRSVGRRR